MDEKILLNAEKTIGYSFNNKELLKTALTHSSFVNEGRGAISNERMEFLGDAILDAIVSIDIYKLYPEKDEGFLSKLRASVVSEKPLYLLSKKYGLNEFLLMGNGATLERGMDKPSILSDCFEAIVAAIYLDAGFEKTKEWVNSIITRDVYEDDSIKNIDYKTKVYEMCAKNSDDVRYELISEKGPVHDRVFEVGLYINNKFIAKAEGATKKSAEQEASKKCLKIYEV